MYNSQNLPLSPRKVAKKFLAAQFKLLPVFVFIAVFFGQMAVFWFTIPKAAVNMMLKETSVATPVSTAFSFLPLAVVVVVGLFLLWELCIFLYHYYYYRLYYYNFEENRAEIRKGVIQRATGMVRYERLQNIYIDQDLLDRVFGLYDVHYETAGESSQFYSHVDGLVKENADKLVSFLNSKLDDIDGGRKSAELESISSPEPIVTPQESPASQVYYSRENLPLSPRVVTAWTISGFIASMFLVIFLGMFFIPFVVFKIGLLLAILLYFSIVVILTIIFYVFNLVWLKNFSFTFDDKKGEIITQVLARAVTYVYYNRIQNINLNQGIVDRFFGISNVSIETAGGGMIMGSSEKRNQVSIAPRMIIPGLPNEEAEILKNFLLEKSQKAKNNL